MKALSDKYKPPLKYALLFQVVSIVVVWRVPNPGSLPNFLMCSILAYWASLTLIVLRRPQNPTRGDLLFEKWGYLAIFVTAPIIYIFLYGI